MAVTALTLFQIAVACLATAIILWVISSIVSGKSHKAAYFIERMALAVVLFSIISAVTATVLDTIAAHQIEYVECEHCGSQVPREEYNP